MAGKFCPQCGAPTQGAKFCPECGARVEAATPATTIAATPASLSEMFGAAAPAPAPVPPAPAPAAPVVEPPPAPHAPATPPVQASAVTQVAAEPAEPVDHPTVPAAAAPAADTAEGETDEADEADADSDETEPQGAVKQAVKKSTKIKVDVTAEPYVPGQCTVNLVLAIQPDDGNSNGPMVVAGVSSHDQAPQFSTFRLNTLGLPPTLLAMVQAYQASLPQRGADKAADEARTARKKAAEEAKRKADAAARQAKSKTPTAKAAATAKPARRKKEAVKLLREILPSLSGWNADTVIKWIDDRKAPAGDQTMKRAEMARLVLTGQRQAAIDLLRATCPKMDFWDAKREIHKLVWH